jgi:hypothetical protein
MVAGSEKRGTPFRYSVLEKEADVGGWRYAD